MRTETFINNGEKVPEQAEIIDILHKYGIPLQFWGKPPARSLEHFINLVREEQVRFRQNRSDCLTIDVNSVVVIVLHMRRGEWQEIYEERQVFPDGTELCRNFNGIAETLHRGELVVPGAQRCLLEELHFRNNNLYSLSPEISVEDRRPQASEKWPGITAVYHRHILQCVIPDSLYKEPGYMKKERDGRRIFFKWKPWRQALLPL